MSDTGRTSQTYLKCAQTGSTYSRRGQWSKLACLSLKTVDLDHDSSFLRLGSASSVWTKLTYGTGILRCQRTSKRLLSLSVQFVWSSLRLGQRKSASQQRSALWAFLQARVGVTWSRHVIILPTHTASNIGSPSNPSALCVVDHCRRCSYTCIAFFSHNQWPI